MEKFFSPHDKKKQQHIIDAALFAFAQNGYKKTSINDIAQTAKVSKGVIFYYFGCKKALYLYLAKFCTDEIYKEFHNLNIQANSDFFDRLKAISATKLSVMKRYPAMTDFLKSLIKEKDDEIEKELAAYKAQSISSNLSYLEDGMDKNKFKDTVDPQDMLKILYWASEGFAIDFAACSQTDEEAMMATFWKLMDILKDHFYKD